MCTDRFPGWSTHVHEPAGGSRILVAVTDHRAGPGAATFVVVQGIHSWIEDFELQRFDVIARTLGVRLVVVEVPGFGVAGSRLLPGERRSLLAGDFGPLATRMFAAVLAGLGDERDQPLSFLGYSMGSSIATAMAKVAEAHGCVLDELVLVEPVALHEWKVRHLLAATRREDRWIADYVATNDEVDGAVAPWPQRAGVRPPTRRHVDSLLLGAALRKGALAGDLRTAVTPRRVVVVHGDRSVLSDAAYQPILTDLRARGIAAIELTVPGHHAFWHSLAAVDDMTRRLKSVLDTPA